MRKILSLLLLTIIPIFLFGFIEDPGGLALWHSNGTENGEQVVYLNARVEYLWGRHETGIMEGVKGYGQWTHLPSSNLKENHPNLTLNSPGEDYKLVILKGSFKGDEKTPYKEEVIVDRAVVSRITFHASKSGGEIEISTKTMSNYTTGSTLEIYLDDNLLPIGYGGAYKMYWVYERPAGGGDIEAGLDNLPNTVNKVLGNVFFTVKEREVTVTIWYNGEAYNLIYNMAEETNMEIFDTKEAYFINVTGPQIFINHSDRLYLKDILLAENDAKPAFVPHTIWDLNTNELVHVDKYNAYAYMKQNDKGVMVAYFYVDEFIMDKILSATLSYSARTHYKNWFGLINETSPWEQQSWSYTNKDTLKYRNLTMDWHDWIPIWNLISYGIKTTKEYEMPRIDHVDWNNIQPEYNVTKSEVEREIKEVYSDFEGLKENPRYKLWAFALQEGKQWNGGVFGNVQTELYNNKDNRDDPRNLKVVEIVYETDGKVYTTVGNDMDLIIAIDPPIDGVEKDKNKPWWAMPVFILASIFIVGIISKSGGFKDPVKFIKVIITLAIVAVIIYFAYLYLFTDQLKWLTNLVLRL